MILYSERLYYNLDVISDTMGVNCGQETCFICNVKVKIEHEASLENHYSLHRDELERIRISNNMKDVVRTRCLMCEEDNPVVLSRLRMHTKTAHGVPLSEYKKKFNIVTERQHVLVEKVLHKCGLCGIFLLLCSDVIAVHIKRHKISHANYNATYMNLMQKSPLLAADVKKEKCANVRKRKSTEPTEPYPPPSIAIPFQSSMVLSGEETLKLDLSQLPSASLSQLFSASDDGSPKSVSNSDLTLQEFSHTDKASASFSNQSINADASDESTKRDVAIEKFKTDIHTIVNKDPKSQRYPLKEIKYSKMPKMTFQDKLRSKLSKLKTAENRNSPDRVGFNESGRPDQNSREFSNVLDKVYQNFSVEAETTTQRAKDPLELNTDADQSLDDLISNIWA